MSGASIPGMLALIAVTVSASTWYSSAVQPVVKTDSKVLMIKREGIDRELEIKITYPTSGSSYPVLVFSHGMYGSANGYGPLVEAVAGAGYVVIQPTHGDSLKYMSPEARRSLLRSPNINNTSSWRERPGEISFCIDSLTKFQELIPSLKGKIDPSHIAVGGHSFGAWTSQMLSGMEMGALGRSISFYEKRAKAYVVISPQGTGPSVTKESLAKMHGPMLMVTGSKDTSPNGQTPEWRKQAYDYASPGNKYLVWIDGATHSFGGFSGERAEGRQFFKRANAGGDSNKDHMKYVACSVVSFLDGFLKSNQEGKQYLTKSGIGSNKGVTVSTK